MRDFVDSERPQWLQQMEPILETLNEGVLIGNDSSEILPRCQGSLRSYLA